MDRPLDAPSAEATGQDAAVEPGPAAPGSPKPPTVVEVIMRCLAGAPQDETEASSWGNDLFKALSKMPKGRDRLGIKLDGRFWSLTRSALLAEFRHAPLVAARGVIRALQCLALTGEEDAVVYVPPVCSLLKLALGYMGCRNIVTEANAEAAAADDDAEEADVVPDLNSVPEQEREQAFSTLLSELDGLVEMGLCFEPLPTSDLRCAAAYLAAIGRLARRLPALSSPTALAVAACLPTHHEVERAGRLFLLLRPTHADLWPAMLRRLCKARQSELAHALVRQSPMAQRRDLAIQHVHTLREQHSYKAALLVVGTYGLRELFPDARRLFREQDIREKVKKGKFGIIEPLLVQQESRPEELDHCRRYLLKCLMDKGHYAAALKLLQQYGYPDVTIDPAHLEAERVERAERYVCLPYPLTQVLMVDSMDSLQLAKQMVEEEKRQGGLPSGRFGPSSGGAGGEGSDGKYPPFIVMGVDVEWTATVRPSKRSWGRKAEADTVTTTGDTNAEGADEAAEGDAEGEEGGGEEEEVEEGTATALEDLCPLPSDAPVLEAMEIDDAHTPLPSSPEKGTATDAEEEEELSGWDTAPIIEITMELEDVGRVPASADGRPSILQLGFKSGALLCDLYALCGGPAGNLRDAFDAFLRGLMQDPRVIKVGFDLMSDFTTLRRGWPQMGAFYTSSLSSILDLMELRGVIDQIERLLTKGGLTDLALRYLGKPLDKSEQLGDWNQRPLHDDQRHYAALDAYACVALFDEIRGRLEAKDKDYPFCWINFLRGDAFGGHYMDAFLRPDVDMEEEDTGMANEGGAATDSNREPSSRRGRNRRRGSRRSRGEGEKESAGVGEGGGRKAGSG